MSRSRAADRVCLALDFSDRSQILDWASRMGPRVGWLKIGLEAFVAGGPGLVGEAARHGRVFLDLKIHDIPNTVARAVAAAAGSGASMINVHTWGGREMLVAAAGALPVGSRPLLIGVTLLTSIDAKAMADLPMAGHPEGVVRRLATLARDCGLDGVVCSPTDLATVRAVCSSNFLTVVPGIRPADAAGDDQRRIASAGSAIASGADILVVGRTITRAGDPDGALDTLLAEIESALSKPPRSEGAPDR